MPDGDFLDLAWTSHGSGPIVVILHGLEGSARSNYARGLLAAVHRRGWRGVLMHFRGCSGEPNRLVRSYHSGETGDLAYVIELLRQREPQTPLATIGISLGGNVLLKWLGERRADAPIRAAVAISVPFLLGPAADRLNRGFSQLYQWHLLRQLRRGIARKRTHTSLPLTVTVSRLKCFRDFDEHVTARLHGFAGAEDYYTRSSSRPYLRHIGVPTLLLQARDDPFMPPTVLPEPDELSSAVTLELSERGGHAGFVAGPWPWRARYWLEERVPEYLENYF